jgi:hypothetical protein
VIELGDLVSSQELPVPLRIAFDPEALAGPDGSPVRLSFALESDPAIDAQQKLEWTMAPPSAMSGQRLNREGDFEGARKRLEQTAARIKEYAGEDDILKALVRDLERDQEAYFQEMRSADRKARYMGTHSSLKSRGMHGGSRRVANREPPGSGGSEGPDGSPA